MTLLAVTGLAVAYGPIRAVDGVSFTVAVGELVALIGANGAGKTSTLRALSGLVPAMGGIHLASEPIDGLPAEARAALGLGHVPEGRRVFGELSVAENLELGAYARHGDPAVIKDLAWVLELFPILRERARQPSGTLSGGEQQMLAIGRALMGAPRLLMLDEPTMGLSPRMAELIVATIGGLRARGLGILLVEQNALAALKLADRVHVMRGGRIRHTAAGGSLDLAAATALYLGAEGEHAA